MTRIGADDKLTARASNSLYDAPPAPKLAANPGLSGTPVTPQPTPTMGETMNRVNDQRVLRTGTGLYGTPVDPVRMQNQYGQMSDADATQRDAAGRDQYRQNLISQIPGPSPTQLAASARVSNPVSQMAQSLSTSPTPAAPVATPASTPAAPGPVSQLADQFRVSDTSVPVIKRVDGAPGLNSPLFTNLDPAKAVAEMQGGTVNVLPASSFAPRQAAAPQAQEQSGPRFFSIGGGEASNLDQWLKDSLAQIPGKGRTAVQARASLMEQYAQLKEGSANNAADRTSADANAAAGRQLDTQRLLQDGLTSAQQRADGASTRKSGQIQADQAQLMFDLTQKALSGDAQASAQLQQLSGKGNPMMDLFSKVAESYIKGAAQNIGGEVPEFGKLWSQISPLLNQVSGQQAGQQPAGQAAPSLTADQRAIAIRDNKTMTRAQKVAALQELGYQ